MAPKAVAKAVKKPVVPIDEPADKGVAPNLAPVLAELHSSDVETQQQGLSRLFGLREYPGAKVSVCSQAYIDHYFLPVVTAEVSCRKHSASQISLLLWSPC